MKMVCFYVPLVFLLLHTSTVHAAPFAVLTFEEQPQPVELTANDDLVMIKCDYRNISDGAIVGLYVTLTNGTRCDVISGDTCKSALENSTVIILSQSYPCTLSNADANTQSVVCLLTKSRIQDACCFANNHQDCLPEITDVTRTTTMDVTSPHIPNSTTTMEITSPHLTTTELGLTIGITLLGIVIIGIVAVFICCCCVKKKICGMYQPRVRAGWTHTGQLVEQATTTECETREEATDHIGSGLPGQCTEEHTAPQSIPSIPQSRSYQGPRYTSTQRVAVDAGDVNMELRDGIQYRYFNAPQFQSPPVGEHSIAEEDF